MVRIALIGLSGYSYKGDETELVSYSWNKLAAIKNIANFDELIVHLPSLREVTKLTRESFERVFNLSNLVDILRGDGRFIIIGDPRTKVVASDPNNKNTRLRSKLDALTSEFLHWTLLGAEWDDRLCSAKEIGYADYRDRNAFGRYVSSVAECSYSLIRFNPDMETISEAFELSRIRESKPNAGISVQPNNFSLSRYGTMIAGEVEFSLVTVDRRYTMPREEEVLKFGSIVFLPESTIGHDEAIRILLEDAYDIHLETQPPEWVRELVAPKQQKLDDQIATIKVEAEALHRRWQVLQEQRQATRQVLRLLYGEHRDLEVAVRDALRKFGADVEDPPEPNKRDGWITVTIDGVEHHAVLEVKSRRKGEFDESGLRQLDQWQSDGISEKNIVAKRVFIGNASPLVLPEDREWPFGANFNKQAKLRSAVAIRSQDLYILYECLQNDSLDLASFWRNLFSKEGALALEELVS